MKQIKDVAWEIMTKDSVHHIIVDYKGITLMIGTPKEIFLVAYPSLVVKDIDRRFVDQNIITLDVEIVE